MKKTKTIKNIEQTKPPTLLDEFNLDLINVAKDFMFLGNGIYDLTNEHKLKIAYIRQIVVSIKDDLITCIFTGSDVRSIVLEFDISLKSITENNYLFKKN